jgi:hypothetical protein
MVDGPKFVPGKGDFNPSRIHTLNLNDPRWGEQATVTTSRMSWFVVIGAIQLALREGKHFSGPSSKVAKGFALALARKLAKDLGLTRADWERLSWHELEG